jgi:hypothetical protein
MSKRILIALFGALLALVPAAAMASPRTVSGTVSINAVGEAGYIAGLNQSGHFTRLSSTFTTSLAQHDLTGDQHGEGISLCRDATNNAVQLFAQYQSSGPDAGKFEILLGVGKLFASSPGTNNTACNSGQFMSPLVSGNSVKPLLPDLAVPAGDQVRLILREQNNGLFTAFAQDLTLGISSSRALVPQLRFPNEAGAIVVHSNINGIVPPPTNALVNFTSVTATNGGVTGNLGTQSRWTAVQVGSTADGTPDDQFGLYPNNSLSGGSFSVFEGTDIS